ncbi:hypothetical protein [Marinomonas transparens]|uniref:Uncharacterized protein n=1 Tax=Marinomonas transparens TaxID=2795388 RepID=A0A934JZQ6_9GAMM|nr:hypothetical protein [Marinomonas transparens]MBJ7539862.1 hypothetical protein [Marinomonas transparens]
MKKIALLIALSLTSAFAVSAPFKWDPDAKKFGEIYSGERTYKDLDSGESATTDLKKDLFCNRSNRILIKKNRLLRGGAVTISKSHAGFDIKFNSTKYTTEEMLGMLGAAGAGKKCNTPSDYDGYALTIDGKTSVEEFYK